jgi:glycine cleavage system pyridoxal-binding protein P
MRYLPKSPAERKVMLDSIGVRSIDELFSSIPEPFRLRTALNVPGPYSEEEVIRYFKEPIRSFSAASFSPRTPRTRRRYRRVRCRPFSSFKR